MNVKWMPVLSSAKGTHTWQMYLNLFLSFISGDDLQLDKRGQKKGYLWQVSKIKGFRIEHCLCQVNTLTLSSSS